jgi:predicted peptidase
MWIFHGANDNTVSVNLSRSMVKALKDAGGNPKYTEYPGVGHDSWNNTYSEPDFLPWLFAQRKD